MTKSLINHNAGAIDNIKASEPGIETVPERVNIVISPEKAPNNK